MSLDELRADLKRNSAEAAKCRTFEDLRDHLVNTLWPFQEAVVDVTEEIDDATAELVDQTEDYLQAETAAVFAALVQSSLHLSAELRKHATGDEALTKRIDAHEQLCQQAMVTLGEITMIPPDEKDEEGDEDDEGEDPDEGEGADA